MNKLKKYKGKIIYTKTDEAPMLATHSLLPIIKAFVGHADITVELNDISLAARILSAFPEYLKEHDLISDGLAELAELVKIPDTNIIKLPNISASVPQLVAAIEELQHKGFKIPSYPENPENDSEKIIFSKYNKIKGSAVNPVLREGNSDRRAPQAVKNYARKKPHPMGSWSANSQTHVATMKKGDFFHNEKSICMQKETHAKIEFCDLNGNTTILKEKILLQKGEIIDASVMFKNSLLEFLEYEIKDAKDSDLLLSIHMKATMMKVSDPIIFGHAVNIYFKDLVSKYKQNFIDISVDFKNGFGDLIEKIKILPKDIRRNIEKDINIVLEKNADLAMVDSDKGISNFHVPSDVIIDASMPAMIKNSGKMWNRDNLQKDTKAIIPDSSYAHLYSTTIDFCKENGQFDPKTMGTVSNVGLMAKKAEEYGSHDKTFEIISKGCVRVIDSNNNVLIQHNVDRGDIWRMCQTKDESIKDWVKLAVNRAKATSWPAIFWLDKNRSHDKEVIKKVNQYLKLYDTKNLDIRILPLKEATYFTLDRVKNGKNTISVTGNVLRDYLTDLFPILELGTSAKMLSIVPLINGGGLFETGAGGSAPKHIQQFLLEGHLRWDSLGEFMALVVSLEHIANFYNNDKAKLLAHTLNLAIEDLLNNDKSPKRNVGQLDNRGSHFYLAKYWSKQIAIQDQDLELKNYFKKIFNLLKSSESVILDEIKQVQGRKENINGYYYPDSEDTFSAMRPSKTFNSIIDNL